MPLPPAIRAQGQKLRNGLREAEVLGQPLPHPLPPLSCYGVGHTLGMSHLPVWDVHFPIVPPGQGEGDGVSGRKHAWDIGLHHLWGEGTRLCERERGPALGLPLPLAQHPSHPTQPHLVDRDEASRIQTDAALPQEARGRHRT